MSSNLTLSAKFCESKISSIVHSPFSTKAKSPPVSEAEGLLSREGLDITRSLADQFSRAALSIPLNIAEGNGRWHKGDKRNFFWIARGSVFECVPIIEILRIKNIISESERTSLRESLEVLGKMLTRLIQAHDS